MTGISVDVAEAVGNTPLIALDRLTNRLSVPARIFAKCEFLNPSGSMKDRMAVQVILDAENSGKLKKGDTVIVLTSGNGGIALATVCAARGYHLIVTMSEGNSVERRTIIKALGAELVLVPQAPGSRQGQVSHEDLKLVEEKTNELVDETSAFRVDQFITESNSMGHEKTGQEILKQTDGMINAFTMLVGTSGSFTGIARVFKRYSPSIRCLAVEPATAPFLSGGAVVDTHHKLQGGGYSQPLPLFDKSLCDGFVSVSNEDAIRTARLLAKCEGLLTGYSSGANVAAAISTAKKMTSDQVIVTILCDSGLRYLSTDLFSE